MWKEVNTDISGQSQKIKMGVTQLGTDHRKFTQMEEEAAIMLNGFFRFVYGQKDQDFVTEFSARVSEDNTLSDTEVSGHNNEIKEPKS